MSHETLCDKPAGPKVLAPVCASSSSDRALDPMGSGGSPWREVPSLQANPTGCHRQKIPKAEETDVTASVTSPDMVSGGRELG